MAFWTKDRELELIKLWGEGLSGSVIAAKLGAESRNQVIGKAFRMKLAARRTTQTRRFKKKRVVQPAPVVESRKYRPSQTLVAEPPIPPQDYDVARIATADLEPHHCKWPVGDPGTPSFGHCGCKRAEGLPYCAQHAARAYNPEPLRRLRPAFEKTVVPTDKANGYPRREHLRKLLLAT